TIPVAPDAFLYRDYLAIATTTPGIELSGLTTNKKAEQRYDQTFKEDKSVYNGPLIVTFLATHHAPTPTTNVHITYYRSTDHALQQELIPVTLTSTPEQTPIAYAIAAQEAVIQEEQPTKTQPLSVSPKKLHQQPQQYSFKKIKTALAAVPLPLLISLWVWFFLCFTWGYVARQRLVCTVLLSLCVYGLLLVLPQPFFWGLSAGICGSTGAWYLYKAPKIGSTWLASLANSAGILALIAGILFTALTYKALYLNVVF
ncbi:MAG TPA: hypothetical protein VLG71_00205, partial [Candidatus Limnocylindria bacterium]|nr:hypothetical protein [Candidatus Limnocylindria bacterium]